MIITRKLPVDSRRAASTRTANRRGVSPRVPMKGSESPGASEARLLRKCSPDEQIQITVVVRRRNELDANPRPLAPISREEFAQKYGANPDDIAKLKKFAADNHLEMTGANPESRTVTLKGNAADLGKAFGVELGYYSDSKYENYRSYRGAITLPKELAEAVQGVFGLQNRPVSKAH